MKKLVLSVCTIFACVQIALAQPTPSPATDRRLGAQQRAAMAEKSLFKGIEFKNIGPTIFSGRVVDIEVDPQAPHIFYVAYASGGLWKTENNGSTFTPIFDQQSVITIGDIAVHWEEEIIWVGTGESNSSRSSYAGDGIYQSRDDGQSWQYLGLPESHHIGRIILHPQDPDLAWVAALGHLYSANSERGIYRTDDGGKTWDLTLQVNENTGGVDLVHHPDDPEVLFAAMWERTRRAWDFTEAGPGSAIYRSDDGGITWILLSDATSGFPTGDGVGRIGLSATQHGDTTHLFAILDNYFRRPPEDDEEEETLTKNMLKSMSRDSFLNLSNKKISAYLKENRFPKKYDAKIVRKMVDENEILPAALAEYLEDANSLLFDTPVKGAEVYHSTDLGKTWQKTHDEYLDRVYNSYGYYFGQIRSDPNDPDRLYIMGVPLLTSTDRGKTWTSIGAPNVHSDHHALWINPKLPSHLINGNDGGINISYDHGRNWVKCNAPSVGQFYDIAVDMVEPYHVYGGTQDNGVWYGPSDYQYTTRWHSSGFYPYQSLLGGDGMQVQVDWRNNEIVYTGFQFGYYFRVNSKTKKRNSIRVRHDLGERPLRFNWQTPIHLSRHDQDILYLGSNKVHRSFNGGEDWSTLSDDLTQGGKKGDVAYGTLTTIHESPLQFGLLYAGSDDGLVHVSKDAGHSWENISAGLPKELWISRVQASAHVKDRVFASLNGYRWDDFNTYLYMSDNQGNTWVDIKGNIPPEPVNVIIEDPRNPNLIYVGTDHGVYVSLDLGETYSMLSEGLAGAPVHDLVVHPEARDLLVGTHGRSIYKASIKELQELNDDILNSPLTVFALSPVKFNSRWGAERRYQPQEEKEPLCQIPVFTKQAQDLEITISLEGVVLNRQKVEALAGLNYLPCDLWISSSVREKYQKVIQKKDADAKVSESDDGHVYLSKGTYQVSVQGVQTQGETQLKIE